jgi:CHAD domain-containing protein
MGTTSESDSKTSLHVEVERKFDVLDSTPSPSFDGLDVVATVRREPTLTLTAVYFDTPGRDLAAHRVTLRRRTGGSDAGWHLKLPGEDAERTEIHADFTGGPEDDVPAALRDVILAIVRDRPLLPVARITNQRATAVLCGADGNALAEFCDDHVTASVAGSDTEQRWREWELELSEDAIKRGTADTELLRRLSRSLRQAGAAKSKHTSKLARTLGPSASVYRPILDPGLPARRAVAEQIEALLSWDRAVRADMEDSVHQMRVAIRTIRSLLQSSPASFGPPDHDALLDELRELAAMLGAARDAEVLADRYRHALDALPQELLRGPVRERLVDGSRDRYRAELGKALSAMRSQRYFRLLDRLEALVLTEPGGPAVVKKNVSKTAVEKDYKRVHQRVEAAAAADLAHRDAALHAVRKSAKRLRYAAEANGAKKVARAARTIQTLLGDHHDSVVSRDHLIEQADHAHAAGDDTFTYGLLYEQEAHLADRSEQQLEAVLKSLRRAVEAAL